MGEKLNMVLKNLKCSALLTEADVAISSRRGSRKRSCMYLHHKLQFVWAMSVRLTEVPDISCKCSNRVFHK